MTEDYIAGSLDDIGFVSMICRYKEKLVLCFHKTRRKWDCPGGHVEKDEGALAAAKRELYEETGATAYEMLPVWDYIAYDDDGSVHKNGRTYYVDIKAYGGLPENSEMEMVGFFDDLPDNVTYDRNEMADMIRRADKYAAVLKMK